MKESDYIAAQNLWRCRLAHELLRGLVFLTEANKSWQNNIVEELYELEESLCKLVKLR